MSSRKPYPYQERVGQLLLSGKSVVLQAPTGAGKTMAALLPFFHAWRAETDERFPSKCIYAVPMRVLAHQFVQVSEEIIGSFERRFRRSLHVSIQTGDQQDDRRFEGDLIFCTIDQFLSSYLTMPYSLPKRLANLNAGAMPGAYIVLDEFHLLDPNSTLPSTLYALKQLRKLAPVLLMTATFSAEMLKEIARELDAVDLLVSPDEARTIETRDGEVAPRQRVWRVAETPLTADVVLRHHHRRSLALCNTVRNAQTLYRALRDHPNRGDVEVLLLHSRFLPEDRRATEQKLKRLFGTGEEADPSGSAIAVATQTIEVGVDITSEVLHTELAPASALIQRAGRCARYPGEEGQVVVYPVESYRPYSGDKEGDEPKSAWGWEMAVALDWLKAHSGEALDFEKEQAFVNAVATPRDKKVLQELSAGRQDRAEEIRRVLQGERKEGDQRLLVRDADSHLVLIHSDRDTLLKNPYGATGFNLQLGTLFGMFKDWQERGAELDWRVMRLLEDKDARADKTEDNRTDYGWERMEHRELLPGARVLLVNPALAGYSKHEGFVADRGDTGFESSVSPGAAKRTWEGFSYRLESYEDHIRLVLQAFQELALPELQFPAQALERAAHSTGLSWPEGSVLRAAWLTCLLHDVGKLRKGWQGWARAYQQQIRRPMKLDFAAAHTDMDRNNPAHREAERAIHGKYPKPHHAGEGALASSSIITQALGAECKLLARAVLTAIVRHHTPFAQECEPYILEAQAEGHIRATLSFVPEEVRQHVDLKLLKPEVKTPPNSFPNLLAKPEQDLGWLAYILFARALRRADQEGTERGSK
ncbi:MAG: CRISPR-associated helicase Cas3' [Chloroflexi bacterium]|nr:CRISPR-associated helicase Cas3' [Chloroflexota bacterium]